MHLKIQKVIKSINNPIPRYSTSGSSGLDIASASIDDIILKPSSTDLIPTNLIIEIPEGYEGQIRPRSGLAIKHNIGILNSPGTIDSDYRGELKIIIRNFGKEDFPVRRGDRVAQLVIAPVVSALWEEVAGIEHTARGAGGFGHTGT